MWSQIGGFIGIFLGYSLLQIPEILQDIIGWSTRSFKSMKIANDVPLAKKVPGTVVQVTPLQRNISSEKSMKGKVDFKILNATLHKYKHIKWLS